MKHPPRSRLAALAVTSLLITTPAALGAAESAAPAASARPNILFIYSDDHA